MNENHSLPAFHFRILFKGLEGVSEADSRFQSVSGLKITSGIPDDTPAAINKKAAVSFLFTPLVLKRAVENTSNSPLRRWVLACLSKSSPDPLPEVLIEVLDEEHKPGLIVRLKKVTAAGWELGELHAEKRIPDGGNLPAVSINRTGFGLIITSTLFCHRRRMPAVTPE